MPKHKLEIEVPPKAILNSDVVIDVSTDDVKLGELRISRGSVDWVPARHHTVFRLSWERFDDMMRANGTRRPAG
ncbi:MAG: hypothetical protein ACYDH6_15845 [Acidimicrobiales bacterium]